MRSSPPRSTSSPNCLVQCRDRPLPVQNGSAACGRVDGVESTRPSHLRRRPAPTSRRAHAHLFALGRGAPASCPTTREKPSSAALRAGCDPLRHLRRDRRLVRQVHHLPRGGGRGDRGRPVQPRPPPGLRGEPGRMGASRRRPGRPVDRRIDTLPHWRRAMVAAGLESSVVGLVGDSPTVSSRWTTPLAFCFIDGGHGEEPAWADFRGWAPHVASGGWLAIHDVFPDPADGGRPPYEHLAGRPRLGGVRRGRRMRLACGSCDGSDAGGPAARARGPIPALRTRRYRARRTTLSGPCLTSPLPHRPPRRTRRPRTAAPPAPWHRNGRAAPSRPGHGPRPPVRGAPADRGGRAALGHDVGQAGAWNRTPG